MGVVLAAMPTAVTRLLAETIRPPLYRVVGEAGAAATFAGRFTECNGTTVGAIKGQRLYELLAAAAGRNRARSGSDRRAG